MFVHNVKTLNEWRETSRRLIAADRSPGDVHFQDPETTRGLFDDAGGDMPRAVASFRVSRAFLDLAETVSYHRDEHRWDRLYRVLWRLTHGETDLLESSDDDVRCLDRMAKAVRRDANKMESAIRFQRVDGPTTEHFIAWHRPEHRTLRLVAPSFARRFPAMRWSILTPDESATWDATILRYGPGVPASRTPLPDELERLWRAYYASLSHQNRINRSSHSSNGPATRLYTGAGFRSTKPR